MFFIQLYFKNAWVTFYNIKGSLDSESVYIMFTIYRDVVP